MPRAGQIAIAAFFLIVIGVAVWFKSPQQVPLPPLPPRPDASTPLPPALASLIQEHLQSVEKNRRGGQLWGRLGMVYDANGLPDLALPCYEIAESLEPEEGRWVYFRSLLLARSGDLESAIKAMERVTTLRDDFNPALIWLTLWNIDLDRPASATYYVQRGGRLQPEDPLVIRTQAELWLTSGSESDVVSVLGPIVEANPNDSYGRYLVGMALLKLGQTDEASRMLIGATPQRPVWGDEWTFELSRVRVHTRK